MNSKLTSKILVTGASGFIGLHTVLNCLQKSFKVRATVRSENQENVVRQTLSGLMDTSGLEFVRADLLRDDGWEDAVNGCDSVIHTASPYIAENPKNESALIDPALDGTLRVVKAALKKGIRRVVLLSTIGAIFDGHEGEKKVFTENDWSDVEHPRLIYHKGKTLAEQAAWKLINSDQNTSNMEMVAINPSNVMGPVLDAHLHTSTEWYRMLMHTKVPGISRTQLDLVDVRDLTDILIQAMTNPQASGKRFICNSASITLLEFSQILFEHFSNRGYKIPHKLIPSVVIRVLGIFDPKVRAVVETIDWKYGFSTEQVSTVFNWHPRSYKETIIDMAESLIKFGLV
jgi:dihydroflavonol-4-reductase